MAILKKILSFILSIFDSNISVKIATKEQKSGNKSVQIQGDRNNVILHSKDKHVK